MSLDAETSIKIYGAYHSGDHVEFERLLAEHPEFLRNVNGTDRWMWQFAMHGQIPFLEAVTKLGLNVNESKDYEDPEDPFNQVEGPILQAAGQGQLETVRWLLERGARISYTVNGQARCLPLTWAATNGHLNVVRLLVEHGADIHGSWSRTNALKQAKVFGRQEVYEYLLGVGATSPDLPEDS